MQQLLVAAQQLVGGEQGVQKGDEVAALGLRQGLQRLDPLAEAEVAPGLSAAPAGHQVVQAHSQHLAQRGQEVRPREVDPAFILADLGRLRPDPVRELLLIPALRPPQTCDPASQAFGGFPLGGPQSLPPFRFRRSHAAKHILLKIRMVVNVQDLRSSI
jgi:hypothetical protein